MNPPFLLPPDLTGFLNLGTMTIIIAITFAMQAFAIAFHSAMVKEYRGVRAFLFATLALACGFIVLVFRDMLPQPVVGFSSNIMIMTGNMLLYVAICRFSERPVNRFLVYGLAPLGYLVFIVLALWPIRLPIIFITLIVDIPLNVAGALVLVRGDNRRYRSGAWLTALPLLVYGLHSVMRVIEGLFNLRQILPGRSVSNVFDVFLLFVFSFIWTAGFILMISQRLQSDLTDLAMNDILTRVRNRRSMLGLLSFEMRRVQRDVKDFSIILLDIDHFKRVNDTYGHDVGDQVLHWMAQTLQNSLRIQDAVARWGGEEFLVLLPETLLNEAVDIAERLRAKVAATDASGVSQPIRITFSAGVASASQYPDVDLLCKTADRALYVAKETRNRVISQAQLPAEVA
jgi:diguanylate cyclase (GGDEF)-like protein